MTFPFATSASPSERDAALLRTGWETLSRNTVRSDTVPWAPHRGIIPAFGTYEGVWNWDAAFHAIAVARWDPDLAWEQLAIFLEHQLPSGGFVDVLFANGEIVSDFGKPPVWPWAVRLIEERAPGSGDLTGAYDAFVSLERHWVENRCQGGLFHYDSDSRAGDWIQQAKYESGWDNSVRFDNAIVELWPPDLNGYMVLFYEAMAWFAERLGKPVDDWLDRKTSLARRIEEALWSEELGAYCDRNYATGEFTGVLSPAAFLPLFAGTASSERARRMADLAADPNELFPGMPTVSYSNPAYSRDMWRGPCWFNTAYFGLKGLQRYGHHEVANQIRETLLDWACREPELREYYDAKTGEGLAARGFGWTAAFVIELILDWD